MSYMLKVPSSKLSGIEDTFSKYCTNLNDALDYSEAIKSIISDQYLLYGWTKILIKLDKIIEKEYAIKEYGKNYIDNLKTLESKLPENPGFSISYNALSYTSPTRTNTKPTASTYKKDNRDGEIVDPDTATNESSSSSSSSSSSTTSGGGSSYSSYPSGGTSSTPSTTAPSSIESEYGKAFNKYKYNSDGSVARSDQEAAKLAAAEVSKKSSSYSSAFNDYKSKGYSDYDAAKNASKTYSDKFNDYKRQGYSDQDAAKRASGIQIATTTRATSSRVTITSKTTAPSTNTPYAQFYNNGKTNMQLSDQDAAKNAAALTNIGKDLSDGFKGGVSNNSSPAWAPKTTLTLPKTTSTVKSGINYSNDNRFKAKSNR